jgi:hypothetical protein
VYHGVDQEPVIGEWDAPLARRFVVNSVRVGRWVLQQLRQALINEMPIFGGQVALLLGGDL